MTNLVRLDEIEHSESYNFSKLYLQRNCEYEYEGIPFPMANYANNCKYVSQESFTDLYITKKTCKHLLSAFSLNCRSLSANWDSYNELLANINSSKFAFDLLGISELFNLPPDLSFELEGYHDIICKNRDPNDSVRGGVGLYIKKDIIYKDRPDLTLFIPHVIETIFVEIKVNNCKNIIVGNIYRPNT